ncbi:hypothetical protein QUF76_12160 [Desulfobacterales bacterium HSG16]|nr:hypothetical protein [Desulfobacterales bacterium HSG16]
MTDTLTTIRYILLSVSIIYFLIALLIEICIIFSLPDLCAWNISVDSIILLIMGFVALVVCTICRSVIEERADRKKHKETPPQSESDKNEKLPFRAFIGGILMLNAAFFFITMDPGKPDFRDGQYVLVSKGRVIEVIDKETYYREINMKPTRGQKAFSAIFLMFSWIAVCGNLDEKKQ